METRRFRALFLLGALIYPLWCPVAVYLAPDAYDPLWQRIIIGAVWAACYWATYLSASARKHVVSLLYFSVYLLTLHYFFIAYLNDLHLVYTAGSYIVVLAVSSTLVSRKSLFWYSAFVLTLAVCVAYFSAPGVNRVMMPLGLATSSLVSYVSLSHVKKLIEALAERERNFRELFDSTFEAIILHENGKVLDANTAAELMFGYEREELIGLATNLLASPECVTEVTRRSKSLHTESYEIEGQRKSGERCTLEVHRKAYQYQGRQVVFSAMRYIGERKEMEARLRVSDRLASIGTLAAGVGHEINNPLFW